MSLKIGYIHIDYTMQEDGDITTSVDTEGDLPLVVQLGIIELSKDTLIHPPQEEEEYDGY